MNRKNALAVIIVTVSVVISLISIYFQRQSATVCHYDGEKIMPVYEVDIKQNDGDVLKFCSVYCAREWFKKNKTKAAFVTVTDELSGEKLDAALAFFVESDVISVAATRNRVHVFKDEHNARTHAQQYNGKFAVKPFEMRKSLAPVTETLPGKT